MPPDQMSPYQRKERRKLARPHVEPEKFSTTSCHGDRASGDDDEPSRRKPLKPDEVVRLVKGLQYFGYQKTQLSELIRKGLIPAPIPLTPGGRAKGWLGWQIIEHQRRLLARAEKSGL